MYTYFEIFMERKNFLILEIFNEVCRYNSTIFYEAFSQLWTKKLLR